MFKIISSEKHAKLKEDIDYWKDRALEEKRSRNFYKTLYKKEKSWHKFYKEECGKRISEYMYLKQKYDELKERKKEVTLISLGEIKNLNKAKKLAKEVKKAINNEHYCDRNCFAEHVLQAIQSDYDSHNGKYRESFIRHWYWNLSNEYPWLKSLYIIDGKIYFK